MRGREIRCSVSIMAASTLTVSPDAAFVKPRMRFSAKSVSRDGKTDLQRLLFFDILFVFFRISLDFLAG